MRLVDPGTNLRNCIMQQIVWEIGEARAEDIPVGVAKTGVSAAELLFRDKARRTNILDGITSPRGESLMFCMFFLLNVDGCRGLGRLNVAMRFRVFGRTFRIDCLFMTVFALFVDGLRGTQYLMVSARFPHIFVVFCDRLKGLLIVFTSFLPLPAFGATRFRPLFGATQFSFVHTLVVFCDRLKDLWIVYTAYLPLPAFGATRFPYPFGGTRSPFVDTLVDTQDLEDTCDIYTYV